MESIAPDTIPSFLKKRPPSAFIQIRINRRTMIAFILSVLLHLLILYIASRWPRPPSPIDANNQPLNVTLVEPSQPQPKAPPEPSKHSAPKLAPRPTQQRLLVQRPSTPTPQPFTVPQQPVVQPKPETPPAPVPTPVIQNQPGDLASYMKAQRAKRGESEDAATAMGEQSPASSTPPPSGVHGAFTITRMDSYTATYTFRGWNGDMSFTHLETYSVEARPGQDIRLQVVRSQIAIIRRYYNGDFSFYSERMQRVVTLSARLEDNASLENFLMREYFE